PSLRSVGMTPLGRIKPGEKVERCLAVLLPPGARPGRVTGELVFHEANGYEPAPVPVAFTIEPLPRPDFAVTWTLRNGYSGGAIEGGGARGGDVVDLVARVDNQRGQRVEGLFLELRALAVPAGLSLNVPRAEVGTVEDAAQAEGRLTFSVKPKGDAGKARF